MKYQYVAKRDGVYRWETPHFDNPDDAFKYLCSLPDMWKPADMDIDLVVKPNLPKEE